MMQWNTLTIRSHLTSRIILDLHNTVTLEVSFALCLCPFSQGNLEGCMFWFPENVSPRNIFSPQTLLWKNHSNITPKLLQIDTWNIYTLSQNGVLGSVWDKQSTKVQSPPVWAASSADLWGTQKYQRFWSEPMGTRLRRYWQRTEDWWRQKNWTGDRVLGWFPHLSNCGSLHPGDCSEN